MALGTGLGSGIIGATSPATLYSPAGLTVSSSTIVANVAANKSAIVPTRTQTLNSGTPLINIQTNAGSAPDGSGKTMIQFEALVNSNGTGYALRTLAQQALITLGESWGFPNLAIANNTDSTNCAVLAW